MRIALMWLLALAVPVQGFAAASMLSCGPGHHGSAAVHSHDGHPHSHDHAVAEGAHDHPAVAEASSGFSNDSPSGDHAESADLDKWSKGTCSACASCCTAAALPSTVISFGVSASHDTFFAVVPGNVGAFLTDGPERPPRPILV